MIRPIRRRALFEEFRRTRPGRCGPVRVRVIAPERVADVDGADPRAVLVAYALPRRTGNAVTRNRVRRRLRAVVDELDRRGDGTLPPGAALLLSADAPVADAPFSQVRHWVEGALGRAAEPR